MKKISGIAFVFLGLQFGLAVAAPDPGLPTQPAKLLQPDQVLEMAMSEPLKYAGQFIPHDSESRIPTCLFKNSKINVVYHYCRKKEAPAVNVLFHPKDSSLGNVKIYAEGNGAPVSQLQRDQYEKYFWKFSANPNLPGYNHNISAEKYATYYEQMGRALLYGCFILEYPDAKKLIQTCAPAYAPQKEKWMEKGMVFWNQPSKKWYAFQLRMRKLVEALNQ